MASSVASSLPVLPLRAAVGVRRMAVVRASSAMSSALRRRALGIGLGSPCARTTSRALVRRSGSLFPLRTVFASATVEKPSSASAVPVFPGAAKADDLPKNFDHLASEQRLYEWWEKQGYFKPRGTGEPYVIPMPPPNVTGALHMGHAMFVTLQDMMVRYKRMKGFDALWVPGTDHAGIATQMVVEKLLASEGTSRRALGRDAFLGRVWAWKEQYGSRIVTQIKRLGASCDWGRERFTLDDGLSSAVAEAFVTLHERGLVYRGTYMVNWAPLLQTAVSDLEVEYSEEPGTLFHFRYPLAGGEGGEFLPVATTRPETILGDTAVAVHPEDPRYAKFVGKQVVVPMSGGRTIPVIADEYVDREFGTGALKITPGHDPNDYAIGQRRGLPILTVMNKDGSMAANCGKYAGLDRAACRKALWADMQAEGLVIKEEPYTLRVPRSQRGGEVIEPLVSEQWFVKMDGMAAQALQKLEDGELRILPQRFEKVYTNWLSGIQDWCVSRQLWWGHRIPVWYVHPTQKAADEAAQGPSRGRTGEYVVARSEAEAREKAKKQFGEAAGLAQEEDVLDTWFSSGLWPFSTLGWPAATPDLQKYYPTQVLETGHDILFFWVARMIMMGLGLTGKLPFDTVVLHGLVRDAQGRKMSKSLGNVVDPLDVVEQQGTDALRFTLATGTALGMDLNLSLERLGANRNLANKFWNAGKLILLNLEKVPSEERCALAGAQFRDAASLARLPLAERWIVSKVHAVVDHVTDCNEKYDFGEAGRALYDLFWGEFADWYLEASKTRLYGSDPEAARVTREVLVYCYDAILKLAHPFMPFITEELWQAIPHRGEALIAAPFPEKGLATDAAALRRFAALQEAVRRVRNARAEYNVEPARRIPAVVVCADAETLAALREEAAVMSLLARLDQGQLQFSAEPPKLAADDAVQLVVGDGVEVFLPVAGLADPVKEVARLSKQAAKIEGELAGIVARLSSAGFTEKAPKNVVDKVREQEQELRSQLAAVQGKLASMKKLVDAEAAAAAKK